MDDSIKRLIRCEEEARERIGQTLSYKEGMKKQALHDAELSMQIMESENEQILENMRNQVEAHLDALANELESELRLFEREVSQKKLDPLVKSLVSVVSGTGEVVLKPS